MKDDLCAGVRGLGSVTWKGCMSRSSGGSSTPHRGRIWKDLQQDDNGREILENW